MMKYNYSEGNTPIDESEAEDLIPEDIQFQEELNEFEQTNIIRAKIFYLGKKYSYNEILNINFLKDIHAKMFGETWKWAGNFRATEKNLGIPPENIRESLRNLLNDSKHWIEARTYSEIETCVRFHHRLVFIHPFPNGNG